MKQLLLFVLETVVLAWLILQVAGSGEVPDVIQVGARLGWAILLVGFLVLLGWAQGHRNRHRPR